MCWIASIFLLERLKGSMPGDVRDFKNIKTRAVKFFSLQGKERKEIQRHSDINVRETCTTVCHRQNWVAQFKRGGFFTCDAPRPGRHNYSDHPGDY
jgi:hypothetical protein